MLGSWNIDVTVGTMPEKVASAFAKLNEDMLGVEYTPIAYLGSQVVNGINHAVLAEQIVLTGKDTKNVVLVIFNEKPAEIALTLVNIERVVESSVGEGAISIDVTTEIPAIAKLAFDEVIKDFVGSAVEPFALLGTQVTKGITYIFAAEVTLVTEDPVKKVAVVTVNAMDKTMTFTDILESDLDVTFKAYLA